MLFFLIFTFQNMRKTAAISLLMLFVFNTIGYKLWFNVAMQQADISLEKNLDKNNFNQQELFTLEIPINVPYQNVSTGYERVDGEITVNGETYKYVQRKVSNDTLFLQCIRHAEKIDLQQKSNDYGDNVNNVAGNNDAKKIPGKSSTTLKFSVTDYTNDDIPSWKCVSFLPVTNDYYNKPFINSGSTHLQKLIKPPQSV